jgi:hypothetical protein
VQSTNNAMSSSAVSGGRLLPGTLVVYCGAPLHYCCCRESGEETDGFKIEFNPLTLTNEERLAPLCRGTVKKAEGEEVVVEFSHTTISAAHHSKCEGWRHGIHSCSVKVPKAALCLVEPCGGADLNGEPLAESLIWASGFIVGSPVVYHPSDIVGKLRILERGDDGFVVGP